MCVVGFAFSGYQIVLLRAQGSGLRRMYLFSGAPNMRGKFIIFVAFIGIINIYCYLTLGWIGFIAHNSIMLHCLFYFVFKTRFYFISI